METELIIECNGKRFQLVEGSNECNGCVFFATDDCPTVNGCKPCEPSQKYMIWKEVK